MATFFLGILVGFIIVRSHHYVYTPPHKILEKKILDRLYGITIITAREILQENFSDIDCMKQAFDIITNNYHKCLEKKLKGENWKL